MYTDDNPTTQDHIDDFNRRMEAMAHHQREACVQLLALRLQRDLDEMNRPELLPRPLWRRAGRWIGQQLAEWAQQTLNAPIEQELPLNPPDEDAVVIVDAEFHVVEPDRDQATAEPEKAGAV